MVANSTEVIQVDSDECSTTAGESDAENPPHKSTTTASLKRNSESVVDSFDETTTTKRPKGADSAALDATGENGVVAAAAAAVAVAAVDDDDDDDDDDALAVVLPGRKRKTLSDDEDFEVSALLSSTSSSTATGNNTEGIRRSRRVASRPSTPSLTKTAQAKTHATRARASAPRVTKQSSLTSKRRRIVKYLDDDEEEVDENDDDAFVGEQQDNSDEDFLDDEEEDESDDDGDDGDMCVPSDESYDEDYSTSRKRRAPPPRRSRAPPKRKAAAVRSVTSRARKKSTRVTNDEEEDDDDNEEEEEEGVDDDNDDDRFLAKRKSRAKVDSDFSSDEVEEVELELPEDMGPQLEYEVETLQVVDDDCEYDGEEAPTDEVRAARKQAAEQREKATNEGDESAAPVYETYKPRFFKKGKRHPAMLCETAALAAIDPPPITYELSEELLRTVESGALSRIQLETITYACQAHEEKLFGTETRAGFCIGDGTGVGKGRIIAGIITENFVRGNRRSVWVSLSSGLIEDAERDFADLGEIGVNIPVLPVVGQDYKPLSSQAFVLPDGSPWDGQQGCFFLTYSTLIMTKRAAKGAAAAVATKKTYHATASETVADAIDTPAPAAPTREAAMKALLQRDKSGFLGSRLAQIVDWLGDDGIIVFDECHRAKNLVPDSHEGQADSRKTGSKTGQAVLQIQRTLPLLRVVYSSATSASSVPNMLYMDRLGLWGGTGCPFKSAADFNTNVSKNLGAMELATCRLKRTGRMLSRTLSFHGTSFRLAEVPLTRSDMDMFNKCSAFIHDVAAQFQLALNEAGKTARRSWAPFWGVVQRVSKSVLVATKIARVVELVEEALAQNRSAVVNMWSTGEARADEYFSQLPDDADVDELISAPLLMLEMFIKNHLPDRVQDDYIQRLHSLNLPANPMDTLLEALGGPSKVAEMSGRKHRLVLNEATGKYDRVHRSAGLSAKKKTVDINLAEKRLFMRGEKRVAIITEAASTGISLHADERVNNRQRRVMITLEFAWAADRTIQQFGRVHRSNQTSPPHYVIVLSQAAGEFRFVSTITGRLQALGALTKGDRRGCMSDGEDAQDFFERNLETKYGKDALQTLVQLLTQSRVYTWDENGRKLMSIVNDFVGEYDDETGAFSGRELDQFGVKRAVPKTIDSVMDALRRQMELSHLMKREGGVWRWVDKTPSVKRFLNRIMITRMDTQIVLFRLFFAIFERKVDDARASGSYDSGINRLKGHDPAILKEYPVQIMGENCPDLNFVEIEVDRGISYRSAFDRLLRSDPHKHAGFYMDYLRGRRYVFAVIPVTVERAFKVSPNISTNPAELYSAMMNTLSAPSIRRYHPTDVEPDTIKALESIQKEWDKQYEMSRVACYHVQRGMLCKFGAKCGQGLRVVVDHMITGDLLFYWAAIKGALQLARAKSVVAGNDEEDQKKAKAELYTQLALVRKHGVDEPVRVLGIHVPPAIVKATKDNLAVGEGGMKRRETEYVANAYGNTGASYANRYTQQKQRQRGGVKGRRVNNTYAPGNMYSGASASSYSRQPGAAYQPPVPVQSVQERRVLEKSNSVTPADRATIHNFFTAPSTHKGASLIEIFLDVECNVATGVTHKLFVELDYKTRKWRLYRRATRSHLPSSHHPLPSSPSSAATAEAVAAARSYSPLAKQPSLTGRSAASAVAVAAAAAAGGGGGGGASGARPHPFTTFSSSNAVRPPAPAPPSRPAGVSASDVVRSSAIPPVTPPTPVAAVTTAPLPTSTPVPRELLAPFPNAAPTLVQKLRSLLANSNVLNPEDRAHIASFVLGGQPLNPEGGRMRVIRVHQQAMEDATRGRYIELRFLELHYDTWTFSLKRRRLSK